MKQGLFQNIIRLGVVLLFLVISAVSWGQTDLVRWNGASDGFGPTYLVSNFSASNITNHGGGTLTNNGQWNQHFQTGSWPNPQQNGGYLNESRYVQFTITPDANYKIELSQFSFEVQMDGGNANFEVRYSKDFSQGYSSFNGTISGSWATKTGNLSSINPVLPGQTIYIRLYVYNTWNSLRIRHSWGGTTGPTITGTVSPAVTGDPTDLGITKTMNNLTPSPGNNVVFTIGVNNLGPNMASGASVVDQLPPGFTYVSNTTSVGSYNSGTGIWTIGDLANSASATLQITAQMQAAGPHTNTATVSHYGSDPVSANNTASVTPTNVCAGCTHTVSGGAITVNAGETYCLYSGSWSGGVILNGGTICIASGATFHASYTTGLHSGTIINRGTVTAYPLSNGNNHTVHIENIGTFTSAYLQDFAGSIYNYGSFNVNGGLETLNGSTIDNYGNMTVQSISFYDTTVTNYNDAEFTTTNSVNVYSGYWDNRLGGVVYLNGNNVNFTGGLDNSGYWEFERISSLSSTLNNYGQMKVYNTASNISSTTYLTNDDLLEFINVPEIQYNGPMLTNNGTITVTHSTTGNFKMNQAINQVFNNGLIVVSGQFEQNAAGSLLVNNCTIEARHFFIGNGEAQNNGLIWATGTAAGQGLAVQGLASILKNAATGHVRGANFTNSGLISGYGAFYFTGTTNMNTGGSFIGDEPNSILFYDTSQTGDNIFDTPGGTVTNVIRPDSMTPYDTSTYDCIAPPSVAGYPPTTAEFYTILCEEPDTVLIPLENYVEPHPPVDNISFTILYNTVRLFEYNNQTNPTNNSTNLTISGKGTFTANTTTGVITFVPNPTFTSGTVEAEYRVSNERAGDPIVYPSPRTKITITFILIDLPPLGIETGTNPVCTNQTVTLSNEVSGGVWESSNEAVATVNESGVVTGVAPGTATISYTVTEESCEDTVEQVITVESCVSGGMLITNPHIRQRTK